MNKTFLERLRIAQRAAKASGNIEALRRYLQGERENEPSKPSAMGVRGLLDAPYYPGLPAPDGTPLRLESKFHRDWRPSENVEDRRGEGIVGDFARTAREAVRMLLEHPFQTTGEVYRSTAPNSGPFDASIDAFIAQQRAEQPPPVSLAPRRADHPILDAPLPPQEEQDAVRQHSLRIEPIYEPIRE